MEFSEITDLSAFVSVSSFLALLGEFIAGKSLFYSAKFFFARQLKISLQGKILNTFQLDKQDFAFFVCFNPSFFSCATPSQTQLSLSLIFQFSLCSQALIRTEANVKMLKLETFLCLHSTYVLDCSFFNSREHCFCLNTILILSQWLFLPRNNSHMIQRQARNFSSFTAHKSDEHTEDLENSIGRWESCEFFFLRFCRVILCSFQ